MPSPRTRFQAQSTLLDQVPGKKGEGGGHERRQNEKLPPSGVAVHEPDHGLLRWPAVDVESVRKIAETRRWNDGDPRMERQIQREITAEDGKKQDELTERHADDQARNRKKCNAAVEDAAVA